MNIYMSRNRSLMGAMGRTLFWVFNAFGGIERRYTYTAPSMNEGVCVCVWLCWAKVRSMNGAHSRFLVSRINEMIDRLIMLTNDSLRFSMELSGKFNRPKGILERHKKDIYVFCPGFGLRSTGRFIRFTGVKNPCVFLSNLAKRLGYNNNCVKLSVRLDCGFYTWLVHAWDLPRSDINHRHHTFHRDLADFKSLDEALVALSLPIFVIDGPTTLMLYCKYTYFYFMKGRFFLEGASRWFLTILAICMLSEDVRSLSFSPVAELVTSGVHSFRPSHRCSFLGSNIWSWMSPISLFVHGEGRLSPPFHYVVLVRPSASLARFLQELRWKCRTDVLSADCSSQGYAATEYTWGAEHVSQGRNVQDWMGKVL